MLGKSVYVKCTRRERESFRGAKTVIGGSVGHLLNEKQVERLAGTGKTRRSLRINFSTANECQMYENNGLGKSVGIIMELPFE